MPDNPTNGSTPIKPLPSPQNFAAAGEGDGIKTPLYQHPSGSLQLGKIRSLNNNPLVAALSQNKLDTGANPESPGIDHGPGVFRVSQHGLGESQPNPKAPMFIDRMGTYHFNNSTADPVIEMAARANALDPTNATQTFPKPNVPQTPQANMAWNDPVNVARLESGKGPALPPDFNPHTVISNACNPSKGGCTPATYARWLNAERGMNNGYAASMAALPLTQEYAQQFDPQKPTPPTLPTLPQNSLNSASNLRKVVMVPPGHSGMNLSDIYPLPAGSLSSPYLTNAAGLIPSIPTEEGITGAKDSFSAAHEYRLAPGGNPAANGSWIDTGVYTDARESSIPVAPVLGEAAEIARHMNLGPELGGGDFNSYVDKVRNINNNPDATYAQKVRGNLARPIGAAAAVGPAVSQLTGENFRQILHELDQRNQDRALLPHNQLAVPPPAEDPQLEKQNSEIPDAYIIKGNPDADPENAKNYADFYDAVKKHVESRGLTAAFDEGLAHTAPNGGKYWIGHSRGVDRLKFAPPTVKTLALDDYEPEEAKQQQNAAYGKLFQELGVSNIADVPIERRPKPGAEHYTLNDQQRRAIDAMLEQNSKQADLRPEVNLQPHQERIQALTDEENPRLLVYHGLGSGKSLSALAAAEAAKKNYGSDYGIVAPASLRGNFQKEVEKFTENSDPEIMSYTGLGLGKKFTKQPETLIMDEAHRLRNPGGQAAIAARDAAYKAKRLLLLTGSPITNSPADLANLISLIKRQPLAPADFEKKYIGSQTVYPGLFNWARGIKPGEKPVIKNEGELRGLLKGHVDYQPSKTPEGVNVNEEKVLAPLSPTQDRIQKALRTKIPPGFLWKLDQEFPLSKDELSKLNSFLTGLRQNSISTAPFRKDRDPLKAFEQSGKLQLAMQKLREVLDTDPRKKAIIYSNHIGAGLDPYAAALAKNNIPHGVFHGGIPTKLRQQALKDYNEGRLRALLIGPAGAEGLSTKGTNLIQLLDPHWHESRTQQARGRGLRFDSHDDLPEELKNVHVQRFITKSEDPTWLGKMLGYRRERTGDEILERLAGEKEKLNERFRQMLREVGSENKVPEKPVEPDYAKIGAWTAEYIDAAPSSVNAEDTLAEINKEAGIRWYKRFPVSENLAVNMSFGGPSVTLRKLIPGTSLTLGNRAPRIYVGTPIPGLAYQQYLSHKKKKIKAEKDFADEPQENSDIIDDRSPLTKLKDFIFGSDYKEDTVN